LEEEMARTMSRRASGQLISVVVLVWLLIGLAAAIQRGYLQSSDGNCSSISTTVVTIIAGPLNYIGLNPKVHCVAPQPSK
jgi:hypothetical protein